MARSTTQRWTAIGSVLVVIGIAAWIASVVVDASDRVPALDSELGRVEPQAELASREEGEHVVARETRAQQPAPVQSDAAAKPRVLTGTFVVLDAQGREYRSESGKFELRSHDSGRSHDVVVRDGQWSHVVQEGEDTWSPRGGRIGDSLVACEEATIMLTANAHEHAVVARKLESVRLRVVAADDERELTGVDVHLAGTGRAAVSPTPNRGRRVVTGAVSPVTIPTPDPPRHALETYWVRATGHAWQTILIDHTRTGEWRIPLPSSASLEVTALGSRPPTGEIMVRVWSTTGRRRPIAEASLQTKRATILESVPTGKVRIRLESGSWSAPRIFGEKLVELAPSMHTTVVVPIEAGIRARLDGTLVLPDAWSSTETTLRVIPLDAIGHTTPDAQKRKVAAMKRGSAGYEWSVEVPPGSYQVIVDPLDERQRVEVPAAGARARIVVPEPATVIVRLADAVTGKRIYPADVHWHRELPKGVRGYMVRETVRDMKQRAFTLRVPVGRLHLDAAAEGYVRIEHTHVVTPGENRVELRLARSQGIRVQLESRGARVPFKPATLRFHLREVGGSGRGAGRSFRDGRVHARVTKPGTYVLTMKPAAGFAPIADRRLTIGAGEWRDVKIELVPE